MSDRIPTFADVCSAIAEGQISFETDGATYQINALELRRYLNRRRPLPTITISLPDAPDQPCDSATCPASVA